tara:strand:+ start:365 stop:535 length:171 start_codon:yes stop_codon:yes gene_type:complete
MYFHDDLLIIMTAKMVREHPMSVAIVNTSFKRIILVRIALMGTVNIKELLFSGPNC